MKTKPYIRLYGQKIFGLNADEQQAALSLPKCYSIFYFKHPGLWLDLLLLQVEELKNQ